MSNVTTMTLADLQKALGTRASNEMLAGFLFKDANSTFHQASSAISGITAYDLEAPAKLLYPVITPLRNEIPRVGGGAGIQANWRAITALNPSNISPWVSGGNRGAVIPVTTTDYIAAYKALGTEVNTDFEAQYAAKGFDDPRALATESALRNLMIQEEKAILGGNTSSPLNAGAATTTPGLADSSTGGTLLNSTAYFVQCAALSFDGYQSGTVALGVQGLQTRVNADGSSDVFGGGTAKMSLEATITTSGVGANTHSITASLPSAILGAAGYAWFLSNTTTLERLTVITTAPTVVLTALPIGTNQLASSLGAGDNSTNALAFDGLITQAIKAGSGAYVAQLGTTMTGDGAGGIVEWDALLKSQWDNFRLGADTFWMGSQVITDAHKKILTGGVNAAQRFVFTADQKQLSGGVLVATYNNKYAMSGVQTVDIRLHPNMPPGMVLATSKRIPYPLSNVGNVIQVRTRLEYFQIDWPLRSRKYESGLYVDEVIQNFFPPSMGFIGDIRPG